MTTLKELMEKTSPTPWHARGFTVSAAGRHLVYTSTDPQHGGIEIAALIVHCVNNFAQVVEALDEHRIALEALHNDGPSIVVAQIIERGKTALAAAQTIPSKEKEGK